MARMKLVCLSRKSGIEKLTKGVRVRACDTKALFLTPFFGDVIYTASLRGSSSELVWQTVC